VPKLTWIGKEAVENHHSQVPFHLLKDVPDLACGDPGSGNLIVEGDNLVALKALLPYYAGQVKCIYIDPPYNTGNEGWVYNDNVKSPVIQKWLGEVVGKEGETLDRHDRWLCMMYPRLALLRQFLREDGAIFISIDDNEVQALRYLMDELFGASNFVATVLWQKVFAPKNTARHFSEDHDYVVVYARNANVWRPNLVPRSDEAKGRYKNPDDDPRGAWTSGDLQARNYYSEGTYPITCPSGRVIPGPGAGMYWRVSKAKFLELDKDGRIYWGSKGDNMPRLKRFISDVKDGVTPQTLWPHAEVGHTQEAKKELLAVLEFETSAEVFITPKPTRLIERILQIASKPGDLILDSFAGSGTTGHAVLKLNAETRTGALEAPTAAVENRRSLEGRRFILVEMEPKIAREITAERVRRVAEGYTNAKGEKVEGLGGGFRYCELGEPLFDEAGKIRETVRFADLARHVYFTETGEPLPESGSRRREEAESSGRKTRLLTSAATPLLGVHHSRAVCLLYNGILGDKSPGGGNALTQATLALLREACAGLPVERLVVYGTSVRLSAARRAREGVEFKQIPYSIRIT
jgi:site-specific DNA-methyltransferase (adenine-specific)/adenine-specific DNA-methyltransferase